MTLLRKVIADTIRFALVGLAIGLGMMVAHEPGSNEFLLRWDATKFVFPLVGATSAAAMVALIRWRMWRRSHPQALN